MVREHQLLVITMSEATNEDEDRRKKFRQKKGGKGLSSKREKPT